MIRDSLVAINITQDDKLLHNEPVPLLFYWNGENDVIDELKKDGAFINFIKEKCMNTNNYSTCKISYFFFKYCDDHEEYSQNIEYIQNIIPICENQSLITEYLFKVFITMYKECMNHEYDESYTCNNDEIILHLYRLIQENFPNYFIKESVVNYVRSELNKTYSMNNTNIEMIIEYLENIIKDEK